LAGRGGTVARSALARNPQGRLAMAKDKKAEAEAPEDGGEGAAPKKSFLSKKLIIMVAAGLVVGGGGAGGYFFLSGKKPQEEKPVVVAKAPPTFVDLPEVLVNLQSAAPGRSSYLKAKIVLEVEDAKLAEQVKPLLPRVMDAFQTYLREMRSSDLEGSAGLYRLRDELTKRVNLAVAPSKINAVLFKEIVVQ
jgi:flagellar protein FliL